MYYIQPQNLSQIDQLDSLVEHRSRFNLDHCELNLFETRAKAEDFHLSFEGFTITSMLRGKKIMHLEGSEEFEYVPGETLMAPSQTLMRIDFPEAEMAKPTQCTALVIDNAYLNGLIDRINDQCQPENLSGGEWRLDANEFFLRNNPELSQVSSRLLQTFTSDDPFKDFEADVLLRKLVLCLLRLQKLSGAVKGQEGLSNQSPFHAVLHHIAQNLGANIKVEELCRVACMSKSSLYRMFSEEYGISPAQLIIEERLRHAKQLLQDPQVSIKEAAYASGFNDPNYFSRIFKRQEGISPTEFRIIALPNESGRFLA